MSGLIHNMKTIIFICLVLTSGPILAQNKLYEEDYQHAANRKMFDSKGLIEYKYRDEDDNLSKVDILLPNEAIEVDFAKKRDEAIGQACRYSIATERRPAILLIVKNQRDQEYAREATRTARKTFVEFFPGRISNVKVYVYRAYPVKAERP